MIFNLVEAAQEFLSEIAAVEQPVEPVGLDFFVMKWLYIAGVIHNAVAFFISETSYLKRLVIFHIEYFIAFHPTQAATCPISFSWHGRKHNNLQLCQL